MGKKPHILLVDDEHDFLEPIAFWLESKGYQVDTASNGEDALEIVKEEKPSIIFLDINMPGIDGFETLRRIRKINKDVPVIIVTAEYLNPKSKYFDMKKSKIPRLLPKKGSFEELKKRGISGFFPKKGSFEELEHLIEASIKTHKKLKEPTE